MWAGGTGRRDCVVSGWRPHPTLCTAACQAPRSVGFSRQEYRSGRPFPSPGDLPDPGIEPEVRAGPAQTLRRQPSRTPLFFKADTTKVVQKNPEINRSGSVRCRAKQTDMEVRAETLTSWGCPAPPAARAQTGHLPPRGWASSPRLRGRSVMRDCDPMGCSPPGPSDHGILQARTLEWAPSALLQGTSPTQGSSLGSLRCRQTVCRPSRAGPAFSRASARAPGDGRWQDARAVPARSAQYFRSFIKLHVGHHC